MALLPILHYPNTRLHLKAVAIDKFDIQLKQLIADMAETMYHNNGIGLAASQVDVQKRVFIMDLAKEHSPKRLQILINPRIIAKSGSESSDEGCLSVPGVYEKVTRAEKITVTYQDSDAHEHTLECDGLMAICIQHEIDHLDGKVFVDYLSPLKQNFIKKR